MSSPQPDEDKQKTFTEDYGKILNSFGNGDFKSSESLREAIS
jgi:hypothetical protein